MRLNLMPGTAEFGCANARPDVLHAAAAAKNARRVISFIAHLALSRIVDFSLNRCINYRPKIVMNFSFLPSGLRSLSEGIAGFRNLAAF